MGRVEQALALVDALVVTSAYGRSVPPPVGSEQVRDRGSQALPDLPVLTEPEASGLLRLAGWLATVVERMLDGRLDEAAGQLNDLLLQSDARPHLHRHGDAPFHLHFHDPGAGLVDGWTAGCAAGLAFVLGTEHLDRLGRCDAPVCDRVFLDTSRNGSRRFCSTACQNRVKAAAHRARAQASRSESTTTPARSRGASKPTTSTDP